MPTTATRQAARRSTVPTPYSRSIPAKRSRHCAFIALFYARHLRRVRPSARPAARAIAMTDAPPNQSRAARYAFMLVLGVLIGLVTTVMVARVLQARRDPVPDSLMHVMAYQLRALRPRPARPASRRSNMRACARCACLPTSWNRHLHPWARTAALRNMPARCARRWTARNTRQRPIAPPLPGWQRRFPMPVKPATATFDE